MGKKSFIVGNGIKTFRKDCGKDEFLTKKFDVGGGQGITAKRCATHPHNIYFELFGETGTFGLLIFLFSSGSVTLLRALKNNSYASTLRTFSCAFSLYV